MVTNYELMEKSPFSAIADPTRRAILDHLQNGELGAGDIAERFQISRPAISRHVRILRNSGLVKERREAQKRFYSLEPEGLKEIDRWLQPYRLYWAARLMDLKAIVEADVNKRSSENFGKEE